MRKREAWWKVMWYEHPHPKQCHATEPQKIAMGNFDLWKNAITLDMLQHDTVTKMLEEVARKQAESEESAAGKAATQKWIS